MNPSFIFISLALALPILLQSSANAADVSATFCNRTTHNTACLSIVDADNRPDLKTTPNGIAVILRDAALATASATSSKISTLLRTATGPNEHASLETCSAGYSSAISLLRTANFGVIDRDTYPSLIGSISDANDVPRDCELSFQEPPAIPSPVSGENQRLRDICVTTLEIINIVVCKNPSFC